jgi:hypothetical protein
MVNTIKKPLGPNAGFARNPMNLAALWSQELVDHAEQHGIARIPHGQRWRVIAVGRPFLSGELQTFRHYAPTIVQRKLHKIRCPTTSPHLGSMWRRKNIDVEMKESKSFPQEGEGN